MDFTVDTAEELAVTDSALGELLVEVYVGGGFTQPEEAHSIFDPLAVRQRGVIFAARSNLNMELAGMIVFVPPGSRARKIASGDSCEFHLMGVRKKYRRFGLGRRLVERAISAAASSGCSGIVLWTQEAMAEAQALYESLGFSRGESFHRNGRNFYLYTKEL